MLSISFFVQSRCRTANMRDDALLRLLWIIELCGLVWGDCESRSRRTELPLQIGQRSVGNAVRQFWSVGSARQRHLSIFSLTLRGLVGQVVRASFRLLNRVNVTRNVAGFWRSLFTQREGAARRIRRIGRSGCRLEVAARAFRRFWNRKGNHGPHDFCLCRDHYRRRNLPILYARLSECRKLSTTGEFDAQSDRITVAARGRPFFA